MNDGLTIAAVERETGLGKDTLRVWERRYGFPIPERDPRGERLYPLDQVERLHLIKRLMDAGHRPRHLVSAPQSELDNLASRVLTRHDDGLDEILALLRQQDAHAIQQDLMRRLSQQGLARFVQDSLAPLAVRIGDAWEAGAIAVFEEHLFTEMANRVLRQALITLTPPADGPRLLLTSVVGEAHGLGLLMVEALATLAGACCIPLGVETPIDQIARAARDHQAQIVGLSFSVAFPRRKLAEPIAQLRALLAANTALWIGGSGVRGFRTPPGVYRLDGLDAIATALRTDFPEQIRSIPLARTLRRTS